MSKPVAATREGITPDFAAERTEYARARENRNKKIALVALGLIFLIATSIVVARYVKTNQSKIAVGIGGGAIGLILMAFGFKSYSKKESTSESNQKGVDQRNSLLLKQERSALNDEQKSLLESLRSQRTEGQKKINEGNEDNRRELLSRYAHALEGQKEIINGELSHCEKNQKKLLEKELQVLEREKQEVEERVKVEENKGRLIYLKSHIPQLEQDLKEVLEKHAKETYYDKILELSSKKAEELRDAYVKLNIRMHSVIQSEEAATEQSAKICYNGEIIQMRVILSVINKKLQLFQLKTQKEALELSAPLMSIISK